MSDVRATAVAGTWYPSSPDRLRGELDRYLQAADVQPVPTPRALIAPHAGLRYSGPVAAFAYRTVAAQRYAAAVLVGPSHFVRFQGVSIWPRGAWRTPFGAVAVAVDLASLIRIRCADVIEHP